VCQRQLSAGRSWASAPHVAKTPEHELDLVAGFVEGSVVGDRLDSVRLGWDAGRNAAGDERRAQAVCVIALVADKSPILGSSSALLQFGKAIPGLRSLDSAKLTRTVEEKNP
jgi:hypothetical protein